MNYNWNWGIFFQLSPDGTYTYLQLLLFGAGWTLATALLAWAIALSVGAVVGVIRTSPNPWLVRLGNAYVELFRNIPLLVQMFLWYFVLPETRAAGDRRLAQAVGQRVFLQRGDLSRPLHVGARCRTGQSRNSQSSQRAAHGRPRHGPDAAADVPLRAVADGISHYPSAVGLGISQHHQEFFGGVDHRAHRTHRRSTVDGRIFVSGL